MWIKFFSKLTYDEAKPHSLKTCSLVIDGQNYFYNRYEQSKRPFVFGLEANEHAKYIRNVLNDFKNASVQCYFVFQGGNTDINKKIEKAKKLNFDFDLNYEYVTPVFMKEVCKQVLEEEGVMYATSVLEAKNDCVGLAQALGCSVLSNDIEFCFRHAPYIPYLILQNHPTAKEITCKRHVLKDFLSKYSITETKAAIFATMSDANIFPLGHFDRLLLTWKVVDRNLYIQHRKLLKWLSNHSENEVLSTVTNFLSINDREKFQTRFEEVIKSIRNFHRGVAANYLLHKADYSFGSSGGRLWFEEGVATQKIAINYINLFKHKHIQGSWAIENKNGADSLMLSIDIIIYAYNLLTNFQGTEITVYSNAENYIKVNTESWIRKPMYECTESVFENGWKDIKQLKLFEHFLIENGIDTDAIDAFPNEAKMLFIALIYFARKKAKENVDVTMAVYCFIVSYVMLQVVFEEGEKMGGISEQDCIEAIRTTEEYFRCSKREEKEIFDGDALKTLVELQYCLVHMNYLNTLCGSPYVTTKYHRTFNGTFVYKLLLNMSHNKNLIQHLFKSAPSVLKDINILITTYENSFRF